MGIRRFSVRLLVLAAVLVVVPALPASAAVSLSMQTSSPATYTVGDTGVPATLHVTNNSNGAQAAGTVTLSQISLWPSCGAQQHTSCPTPDLGVVALSATGSGVAGSACAGQTFTISAPDATGKVSFTPANQVVLAFGGQVRDRLHLLRAEDAHHRQQPRVRRHPDHRDRLRRRHPHQHRRAPARAPAS